jgi:hypothetical protein
LNDWQIVFDAIDAATMFMEGFAPYIEGELKLARLYVEKIAVDPNSFIEAKSDQVIRLLRNLADEMEACLLQFMSEHLRDAADAFRKLGYPKNELHLVG